jgi:hypothetical protein
MHFSRRNYRERLIEQTENALGSAREYLALESGLPSFPPDYTCPVVLRMPLRVRSAFDYRALTFYGPAFQQVHLAVGLVTLLMRSYNPQSASTSTCVSCRFQAAGALPLLRPRSLRAFPTGRAFAKLTSRASNPCRRRCQWSCDRFWQERA